MGTVKYTGPVASFHCPTNAEIRSLKVHFSPKQEGSGDPSPENVRPIVGWDGVEVHESRKNMAHILGFSTSTTRYPGAPRQSSGSWGTTLNTVNFIEPDTPLIVTQEQQEVDYYSSGIYKNGYFVVEIDNLIFEHSYMVSFKISNILTNPFNRPLSNIKIACPSGTRYSSDKVDEDRVYFRYTHKQNTSTPEEQCIAIYNCGMSFTMSEFMVTEINEENQNYEPYTDKRIVTWNQWAPPLTSDNWRAYNTNKTEVTFNDDIATSTWLTTATGYSASIQDKNGTRQSNGQIWYGSYMLNPSINSCWGIELCGGRQPKPLQSGVQANTWSQCSTVTSYYRGTENYFYIANTCNASATIGMSVQIKAPLLINLTQMFGAGNEPTKEEFEEQCALNGIDLTNPLPYNQGVPIEWKISNEVKQNITFPIFGKNKFNINAPFANPSSTSSTNSTIRTFEPYTYCLGISNTNYYNSSTISNFEIIDNTINITTSGSYGIGYAIPLSVGHYKISYTGDNMKISVIHYRANGTFTNQSNITSSGDIDVLFGSVMSVIIFSSSTLNEPATASNIQIEYGTTATTYEAFDPKHTVYGGWVDLISGEVCEEYKAIKATWGDYVLYNSTSYDDNYEHRKYICDKSVSRNGGGSGFSNVAKKIWSDAFTSSHFYVGNSDIHMFLPTGTSADLKVNVYAKLAEPILVGILTPSALQTFLGQNNVWSNADYVEVEYDLHETQSLLQRKAFIMANQPHIVKPAAASLQNFKTDVIAPLKKCKVHFEPVQEGTGDPSPSNVRPITGWTGCEVYRTRKNLLNETFLSDYANYSIVGNYGYRYTEPIFLNPNTEYKFSFTTPQTYETTRYWAVKVYDDAYANINDIGTVRYLVKNKVTADQGIITGAQGVIRFAVYGGQATLDDIWNNTTVQLELGSTATSYEPYSGSTIPITFPATINLFNEQWEQGNIEVGNNAGSSTSMRTGFINVNPSTSYYLYTPHENNVFVFEYLEDGTYADKVNGVHTSHIFTTGSTTKKIRIADRNSGTEAVKTGINYPSTITYYEPYGTIYGGYVDLVNGEIVQEYELVADTWGNIKYSSVNSTTGYQYGRLFFKNPVVKAGMSGVNKVSYCNVGKYDWNLTNNATPHFYIDTMGGTEIYTAYITLSSTTNDNLLITCAGKLINPIVYPLNFQTLKTLRGTNNIWANNNGGNIEVSFWRH